MDDFLFPLIDAVEGKIGRIASVRGDAGMPDEDTLHGLETRRKHYAFRIKSNAVLKRIAEPYLKQVSKEQTDEKSEWTFELSYKAKTWSVASRVALVIVEREPKDMFEPFNYFFVLTNWTIEQMSGFDLLDFYRKRGTMERWIGEFKDVFEPALSCASRRRENSALEDGRDDFACNEATLLLYGLAYNLLNTARRLMEEATDEGWSLRRFREQVLKTAMHFTLHARRVWAWLAGSAVEYWRLLGFQINHLHPIRV